MTLGALEVGSGTYGLLINAVAKMGDLSRVERIFKRMELAKVEARELTWRASEWHEVSGSTFNALISSCARQGDVDRAEYWLQRMLKSSTQVRGERGSFKALRGRRRQLFLRDPRLCQSKRPPAR